VRLGVAALAVAAGLSCGPSPTSPDALSYAQRFDLLWQRYDATYPAFDIKQVNWDTLGTRYRDAAAAATTEAQFVDAVTPMFAPLRDLHAWFTKPDGTNVPTYVSPYFVNWQRSRWLSGLGPYGLRQQSGNWGYAMVGNVPYVYFAGWNSAQFSSDAVDAVLEQFRNAPAMIVDVRMNGGGDDALAFAVAGRFFDRTRTVAYVQYRNGPRHSDLTALQAITVSPRGSWQFTKPVLLLIGRGCASSNEEFIAAMHEMPNVIVAGDTTAGASGNPTIFPLGGGWSYSVPRWNEFTAEGQLIEWHGIVPAPVITMTKADLDAGRDPVFDYAVSWAGGFTTP
jgi:Peptidase family S41/Tricorn protease C1 domain